MKFWRRRWSLTSWLYSDGSSHHKESGDEVLKEMAVLDLLCITRWGAEWWGIPQTGGRIIPNQECLCSLLSDRAHCHQQWQKMQINCWIVWSMTVGLFTSSLVQCGRQQLGLAVIASNNSHQVRSINSFTLIRKFQVLQHMINALYSCNIFYIVVIYLHVNHVTKINGQSSGHKKLNIKSLLHSNNPSQCINCNPSTIYTISTTPAAAKKNPQSTTIKCKFSIQTRH